MEETTQCQPAAAEENINQIFTENGESLTQKFVKMNANDSEKIEEDRLEKSEDVSVGKTSMLLGSSPELERYPSRVEVAALPLLSTALYSDQGYDKDILEEIILDKAANHNMVIKDEDQNEIKESKVIPDVVIGETDPNSRPTSGKKTEDNNEVKDSELPQAIGEVLNEKKKSKLNSSSCELKETDLGHIRDIFAMFDNEKSGTIMASQVGEMIRSVGLDLTL